MIPQAIEKKRANLYIGYEFEGIKGWCGMETHEYRIGDVADIVGLSRDALRFYEKKGVITSQKKENGSR